MNYGLLRCLISIMETKEFSLNGIMYLAIKHNVQKYAIVEKENNRPVSNMKDIAREYLKRYEINISTEAI